MRVICSANRKAAHHSSAPKTAGRMSGPRDLRIVLIGKSLSGKSTAGNAILGQSVFKAGQRSGQCEVRHGDVSRRRVTVVDSPGYNSHIRDTSEMDKLEIQNSVCLCPPGPHAVLLIVPVDQAFTKAQRAAVEQHMALLPQDVWSYAIVLFTHGDWLGDTTIGQHIETEGEDLRWLLAKCGSRYHVFSNEKGHEAARVTELLEKIEVMVAENSGGHYEVDEDVSEKISERKRQIDDDAQVFMEKKQRLSNALKELFEGEHQTLPEVNIMLVGGEKSARITGTSVNLRNKELRDTHFKEFKPQIKLTECVRRQSCVAGRNVSVVNCPDWSTARPSQKIKDVLVRGLTLCSGLHAVLLIVSAMFSFSEADRRSVEEHMELLGDRVWRHALVLFTWGWWLGERNVEEYIVAEGEPLRWLLEKCGYRYHVLQFSDWDISEQTELMEKVEDMVTTNRGQLYMAHETRPKSCFKMKERHLIRRRSTFTAKEWDRREAKQKKKEEKMIDVMFRFAEAEPKALTLPAVRRRRDSRDLMPPSMSGGTPSETGSSYYQSPDRKVYDWLRHREPAATSSDTMSTASRQTDSDSRDGGSIRATRHTHKGNKTFITAEEWNRQHKEWSKREEEMTKRLQKLLMGETVAPNLPAVRRRIDSMDLVPPSMSGGTPSEIESSYEQSPGRKVSDWLLRRHCGPETASSGYDTTSESSSRR